MGKINQHSFLVEDAEDYGVGEAIILYDIRYWLDKHISNNTNIEEGRYWVYDTYKELKKRHPYFSKAQIKRRIKNIVEDGILIVGEFNKSKWDKTNWYSIKEAVYSVSVEETKSSHRRDRIVTSSMYTNKDTNSKIVETPKAESDYPSSCEFLEEAKSIANHLLESIVEWDPDHKYSKNSPALKSWVVEIERAIRLDGRTKKQLDFVIDYVYNGNSSTAQFWSGNMQSGKKLRKHFDKIKNQIKQERGSSPKQEWNKSRANTLKEYN